MGYYHFRRGLENVSVDGKSTWICGVPGEGGPMTWRRGTEHHKGGQRNEKRRSVPGKWVELAAKGGLRTWQRVRVAVKGGSDCMHRRGGGDMVHSASQKANERTTLQRLPTYKV